MSACPRFERPGTVGQYFDKALQGGRKESREQERDKVHERNEQGPRARGSRLYCVDAR